MSTVVDDLESPRRRRIRRTLTTIVIIACGWLLVIAAQHTQRGDKDEPTFTGGAKSDPAVQLFAPDRETNVLSQAQILLDLDINHDATMRVAGLEIPTEQLQKQRETGVISFTPGPGKAFERLPQGRVCVDATIFRIDGQQEDARDFSWCFNVT